MNFFYLFSLASGTLLSNAIDTACTLLIDRKSIRYVEIYDLRGVCCVIKRAQNPKFLKIWDFELA
jgi:hypothetical protein